MFKALRSYGNYQGTFVSRNYQYYENRKALTIGKSLPAMETKLAELKIK